VHIAAIFFTKTPSWYQAVKIAEEVCGDVLVAGLMSQGGAR